MLQSIRDTYIEDETLHTAKAFSKHTRKKNNRMYAHLPRVGALHQMLAALDDDNDSGGKQNVCGA